MSAKNFITPQCKKQSENSSVSRCGFLQCFKELDRTKLRERAVWFKDFQEIF